MTFIFWFSLCFILYTYIGYPCLLWISSRFFEKTVKKSPILPAPMVSIVVAARNEETQILRRLNNLFDQDYPPERMEIIVVSDGSTDATADAVRQFEPGRSAASHGVSPVTATVRLIEVPEPQGKAHALNLAVSEAIGDYIVFADARQTFAPNAVRELVSNFSDPAVGCVSGELLLVESGDVSLLAEMGAYWRYEKFIRKAESRTGSVVGATGAIYAIRRSLYQPLPDETLLDDVLTPLNVASQGYRILFDSDALAYDVASKDVTQEWRRKVRTLAGNWQLLSLKSGFLKPAKNPLCWRLLSHKLFRLLVPAFLILLFFTSISLDGFIPQTLTILQILFYLLSLSGLLLSHTRKFRLVNLSYFFLVLNFAAVVAFIRWVTGRCTTVWQPQTHTH